MRNETIDTHQWQLPEWLDPDTYRQMYDAAITARANAYAAYSNFKVGAALLDEAGNIHAGCNVENAAYPQGVCAEAGAISAMVLSGGKHIRAALVLGDAPEWVTPCGGCRQKLREFSAPDMPVLLCNPNGLQASLSLDELLPHSFGPAHLMPQRS
jgi:cytidine deaminase